MIDNKRDKMETKPTQKVWNEYEHKYESNFTKDKPGRTTGQNRMGVSTTVIHDATPTEYTTKQDNIDGGRRRYKIKRYSKTKRRYNKTKRRNGKTKRTRKTR